MIISLVGKEKAGKTDWACTAPKPLAHEEFDLGGLDRVSWRYKEELESKLIRRRTFHLNEEDREKNNDVAVEQLKNQLAHNLAPSGTKVTAPDVTGNLELWNAFLTKYIEDVTNPDIRTIIIDSGTNMWPICHRGLLQEKQQIARATSGGVNTRERLGQIEFGEANARFEPVLFAAREMGKNLIIIHHSTEERISQQSVNFRGEAVTESVETGNLVHQGWKHIKKYIDLEVWLEMKTVPYQAVHPEFKPEMGKPIPDPVAATEMRIAVSGLHRDLLGIKMYDSSWDSLVSMVRMLRGEEV